MSPSTPDAIHAVLGIVIKLPPEALVPLLIGSAALLVLVFAGSALSAWKQRNKSAAAMFGKIVAGLLTAGALYFLSRCLWNQADPNNAGTGQLSFFDPPIAGFLASLAVGFWRMGEQRKIALWFGVAVGALMIAKPFIWPVIHVWEAEYQSRGLTNHARGMLDPEHLEFFASGIVVLITGLIAGTRPAPPPPPYPPYPRQPPYPPQS